MNSPNAEKRRYIWWSAACYRSILTKVTLWVESRNICTGRWPTFLTTVSGSKCRRSWKLVFATAGRSWNHNVVMRTSASLYADLSCDIKQLSFTVKGDLSLAELSVRAISPSWITLQLISNHFWLHKLIYFYYCFISCCQSRMKFVAVICSNRNILTSFY